jgi:hypothetical protein
MKHFVVMQEQYYDNESGDSWDNVFESRSKYLKIFKVLAEAEKYILTLPPPNLVECNIETALCAYYIEPIEMD